MLDRMLEDNLIWFPEKDMGYYPVKQFPYDADYFNKYIGYAYTDMGEKINQARVAFVSKHYTGKVLDVGIGCGQFILSRENTFGFDVNPAGIEWLKKRDLFIDLYDKKRKKVDAITFWDSLEHIADPEKAIKQSKQWVFVSMPIYADSESLLNSKHFRKDEHYWYFTNKGLVSWFSANEFSLIEVVDVETTLGRERVLTYAFKRRDDD
ncbi:hypothetical protein DRH13_02295 [Candidatus Woesebacteria bacterium]|nr:MAG: hypothetical protein DRH13_02295 [Candidatus Woesebacteria bacterium]